MRKFTYLYSSVTLGEGALKHVSLILIGFFYWLLYLFALFVVIKVLIVAYLQVGNGTQLRQR